MSKFGKRLITAAKEANTIARGEADPKTFRVHVPKEIDVQAIRKETGLSQGGFAARYAIPTATLRDWEQNRREPDTTTRAYLTVIQRAPDLVASALASEAKKVARAILRHAATGEFSKVSRASAKSGAARTLSGKRSGRSRA